MVTPRAKAVRVSCGVRVFIWHVRYIDGDSTALESWIKASLMVTIAWYVRLMVMASIR